MATFTNALMLGIMLLFAVVVLAICEPHAILPASWARALRRGKDDDPRRDRVHYPSHRPSGPP